MKRQERWIMYYEIKRLKEIGLNVSQISRKVGVSRNRVYHYLDLTPVEVDELNNQQRQKKLDKHHNVILSWLREYPDLSSSQVMDWLKEQRNEYSVCESTVGNYVRMLRRNHSIQKSEQVREHEAIEDPPMGYQVQVDLGSYWFKDIHKKKTKLHVIAFVLSNSRYKFAKWQLTPFTTSDLIQAHEEAFAYFDGIPYEMVYDQDRLVLVNENYGELLFTREFGAYRNNREFQIFMCRKADPQSKGRIENVIGFLKKNFAKHRIFQNIEKLNEECIAWLERTGNGKTHNITKKIPAEVFLKEQKHLRPYKKINVTPFKNSITALVRKDNTVFYKSNRYTLPLDTYDGTEKYAELQVVNDELVILNKKDKTEITRHPLCRDRGKLIKNSSHKRDRSKSIDTFIKEVSVLLGDSTSAVEFLNNIRIDKGRYVRDQLQLIKKSVNNKATETISQALEYCMNNQLYSATCFRDALSYFEKEITLQDIEEPLYTLTDNSIVNMSITPVIRDLEVYQVIAEGGADLGFTKPTKNA